MPPSFISDEEMAAYEAGGILPGAAPASGLPDFISDSEMEKLTAPAPRTFTDEVAGGTSRLLNALTLGLGDEIIGTANAGIDWLQGDEFGEAYNRRLAQARDVEDQYGKAHPVAATLLDVGGGVHTALAAPSVALKPGQGVLKSLSLLGAEGAAYGGAYGFAEGEGGLSNRLEAAAPAAGTGALFSTVVGAPFVAGGAIRNALREYSPFVTRADKAAGRILNEAAGDAILAIPDQSPDPLFPFRTTAEATQSPKLAQFEQSITKTRPEAGEALVANEAARRAKQQEMLDALSGAPRRSPEDAGESIRELIEPEAASALQRAEKVFGSINPDSPVSLEDVRRNATNFAAKSYQAGGMPREIRDLVGELNKKVGKTVNGQKALVLPSTRPYSYMHALRRRAQRVWVDAKSAGDKDAAAVANQIWRGIDSEIEASGRAGLMPMRDVKAFRAGKKLFEKYADKFEGGHIGSIRQKVGSRHQMPNSSVAENFFNGTAERTKGVLRATPNTADAIDDLRGLVRDKMFRETSNNDGVLSPEGFRKWLRKNREGLTAKAGGKQLFDEEHITALERIADDLAFIGTSSDRSVKHLAHKASKGQPTTAQASFLKENLESAVGVVPGGNWVSGLLNTYGKFKGEKIQEHLGTALLNKSYAKKLVSDLRRQPAQLSTPGISGSPSIGPRAAAIAGATLDKSERERLRDLRSRAARKRAERGSAKTLSFSAGQQPVSRADAKITSFDAQLNSAVDGAMSEVRERGKSQRETQINSLKSIVRDVVGDNPLLPLMNAVASVESNWNPKATSRVGAKGLFQLMPANVKHFGVKDVFDPKQNVTAALALMKEELGRFKSIELAVAAYNAGSPAVNRAIKRANSREWDKVRQFLPLETQKYVPKVLSKIE